MAGYPPPRYGTPRDPQMATRGARVAYVAARLGTPFLGWQRHVVDVATEHDAVAAAEVAARRQTHLALARQAQRDGDYTSASLQVSMAKRERVPWRYKTVVVAVPRQSGKTAMLAAVATERVMSTPETNAYMTCQMGKYATARWSDIVEAVEADGALSSVVKVRRSAGTEALTFPNRAALRPFPPTEKSLHSTSTPYVSVDEAWAFDAAQGGALDAAIKGAQLTRSDRQLWIASAAGTAGSEWWSALVERGRASVGDPKSDIAYFEWSADPEADPYDHDTWRYHPAMVEGGLITEDTVQAEAESLSRGVFVRNLLNLGTTSLETVVPGDVWADLADHAMSPPAPSTLTVTYDVAYDRSESAVLASWLENGLVHQRVVQAAPGVSWLAPAVRDLADRWHPAMVGADDGGPARQVTDDLRTAGYDVVVLGARDFATATGDWLTAVLESRRLRHDGDPDWSAEISGAVLRKMGQAQAWDRVNSAVPIPRTIAGTVGLRLVEHGVPLPAPEVRFG